MRLPVAFNLAVKRRPKNRVILGHVLVEVRHRGAAGCWAMLAPRCTRPTIASFFLTRAYRIRR